MASSGKIPVIGIAGRSGSGKTTLIERLIPLLRKERLRIAVIKHTHHDLQFDVPGKDTHRHKQAGAATAILVTPSGIGIVKDIDNEPSLDDIILRYADDADMVIVEGFKHEKALKIEVFTKKKGREPLCASGEKNYIAIVTDDNVDVPLPRFARDDVDAVARFIISGFLKGDAP
ncbi:MAG TPA: molybdopterin-guanine dinucleotide biosynthesis protein B [Syntrophorhabdaceae bacterium]|nr:molybdopterin-guanine dinucleotide biosynthesis protein B [Syntrophorhabdaceae bacterium]